MITSALTERFGYMFEAEHGDTLDQIDTSQIRESLLAPKGGAILFRSFRPTEGDFKSFTEKHGRDFVVHHNVMARDYENGDYTLATVNKGDYAIDFHNEMAANPISPDVFWMLACSPAQRRGRTGIVDGAVIADELTEKARELFSENAFLFKINDLPRTLWSALLPGRTERSQVENWLSTTGKERGIKHFEFHGDELLSLDFVYRGIRASRLSGVTAFCCGIMDAPDSYTFEDGSRPESPFIVEVSQVAHQNALWLQWQPGDLLVLDNTRILHAREAFDDANRKILVRYSSLN